MPTASAPTPASGLATLFFRNCHLLVLATVLLLVAGGSALQSLPRLEDPIITQRGPIILCSVPGASAERVEALVSKPLEDALGEIPEIKRISSNSRDGISVTGIELLERISSGETEAIFARIRDQMREAARQFPPEALPPVFDEKRGAVAFTLLVGVTMEGNDAPQPALLKRHAEALADQLRSIAGTELVRVYGAPVEEFRIAVDPAALTGLGLTVDEVAAAIRAADTKSPAGFVQTRATQFSVEVEAGLEDAERLGAIPLRHGNSGGLAHLRDIATIERAWKEPENAIGAANGRRAVFVAARVQSNQRVDLWSPKAAHVVETYRSQIGRGISLETVFEQESYTTARLGELASNLILGAIVVGLVVLATMGWRAALIVSSALPLSAAATLFFVSLSGGSIQQMSIFGMIIAIGLLIDNAIVITDEIRVRMSNGASPLEAVGQAVRHLFVPLLSSSLTTIFAFAPILLLPGNAGDFVSSIGGSVIYAITVSFLIAMTLIAAFAGLFGRSKRTAVTATWWRGGIHSAHATLLFQNVLRQGLKRPIMAVFVCLRIPAIGFFQAAKMNVEFFPPTDRNMFSVRVWLPTDSTIEATVGTLQAIEHDLRQRPGVERVHWLAGGSFPSVYYNLVMRNDNTPGFAQMIVVTRDAVDVRPLLLAMQQTLPSQFPQAQIVANAFGQGPPADAEVEIRVIGEDLQALRSVGESVRLIVASHPQIQTSRTTISDGSSKAWFVPDRPEVQLVGWTPERIAAEMRGRLEGTVAGTVLEDLETIEIRVRLAKAARDTPAALRDQYLPTTSGEWIPLAALGRLDYRPVQGAIDRRDRERVNTVQGFVMAGTLPIGINNAIARELSGPNGPLLPSGVRLEFGGDAESQSDALGNLGLYLPILGILTVGVLILSFNSLRIAVILSAAAFLSTGFGLLATWLMGFPLSFNTMLGSLGLVGLAYNASIVVVAAIRAHPSGSTGDVAGMIEAVSGCGRHLTSTTLTTIGSCLPLLFFIGGDFWPPLAIVLVGGVGGSTLLALYFTPALYRRFAVLPIP